MKIGKADLRLKLKKYGNEARLVFSSMKIGKDNIRLKWINGKFLFFVSSLMKIGNTGNK